jgi:hypothetical protein
MTHTTDLNNLAERVEYVSTGATISGCGRYRYRLWREWRLGNSTQWDMWTEDDGSPALDGAGQPIGEPLSCVFVMLNPSTADGQQDDPTIRRCVRFAQDWGFDRLEVVNLFAWRATDPREVLALTAKGDPIGPDNQDHIERAVQKAGMVVCAWGVNGAHIGQDETVRGWIADGVDTAAVAAGAGRGREVPVVALKLSKDGFPCHPLYLPAALKPFPYSGRAGQEEGR